jgi:hypothetical protein
MRRRRYRALRRALRALRSLSPGYRAGLIVLGLIALAFAVNWTYQAARKPAELFFPVSGALSKTPQETWRQYAPLFREHATAVITPDFLAALAQVEAAGNPVARTYWRWRLTTAPFEVYRPASSAVGMYQITDATYIDAKRYCIHDHAVVEDGRWYEWRSCWFNSLYLRVVPSHAVEMTSALLDHRVNAALRHRASGAVTLEDKQNLAAVIHLCGAMTGERYIRRAFRLLPGQRCGDHDVARYLARVDAMKRLFARLAGAE